LTGNARRALISDRTINNRQVGSAGQAAFVAMRRILLSLGRRAMRVTDVETLDRSRIPEMKLLTEFAEQNEEGLAASLYLDRPQLKTARAG
jgi:hypothetical protein